MFRNESLPGEAFMSFRLISEALTRICNRLPSTQALGMSSSMQDTVKHLRDDVEAVLQARFKEAAEDNFVGKGRQGIYLIDDPPPLFPGLSLDEGSLHV